MEWLLLDGLARIQGRERGQTVYLRLTTKVVDQALRDPAVARIGEATLPQSSSVPIGSSAPPASSGASPSAESRVADGRSARQRGSRNPHPARVAPWPPAELDQLGDEIAELSAHLEAATARLLQLLREFDARKGWNTRLCLLAGEANSGSRPRKCAISGPGGGAPCDVAGRSSRALRFSRPHCCSPPARSAPR